MRYHEDERARRFCDLFEELPGDVNLFILKPGQISAWHRHREQIDTFVVLSGKVRFGSFADGFAPYYRVVAGTGMKAVVPNGLWHGYENVGPEDAWLLMYLSHKYEDGWDEERRTLEEMPWNP